MASAEDSFLISRESKIRLQNQVADILFVDKPVKLEAYKCCSCEHVAIDYCKSNCNHVFCNMCYLKHFKKPCPKCETTIEQRTQDSDFERAMLQLKVSCKFKKNGCEEIVALRDFLDHIEKCKWETRRLLPKVYKETAAEDMKQINLDLKQMKEEMQLMQAENKKNQEELKNLKQMLKKDDETIVLLLKSESELASATAIEIKKNQEEMLNMKVMLGIIKDRSGGPAIHEFQWRISGFQEKLQDLMDEKCVAIASEEEFSISDEFKVKPWLQKQSDGEEIVHIYLELTGDNGSSMYPHSRKYILLDQSDSTDKTDIELIDTPSFRMNSAEEMISGRFYFSYFFPASLFKSPSSYLKQDEIVIKVILEPISLFYKEVASNDGTLFWRIDNYSKKKQDEIDGIKWCLISQPFKTRETGYTMQVILFLNGYEEAKGSHISMFIRFVLGEWDEFLPLRFKYKYSFHILDQSESQVKENLAKEDCQEFKADELNWGFPELEVQSVVEGPKYLKNDALLLKTVVEIL